MSLTNSSLFEGKKRVPKPKNDAERRQRHSLIDDLLARVSQTPQNLLFGVRIRRKYAAAIARRYGFHPQPYYCRGGGGGNVAATIANSTPAASAARSSSTDSADRTDGGDNEWYDGGDEPNGERRTHECRGCGALHLQRPPDASTTSSYSDEDDDEDDNDEAHDDRDSLSSATPPIATRDGINASRINGVAHKKSSSTAADQSTPTAVASTMTKSRSNATGRRAINDDDDEENDDDDDELGDDDDDDDDVADDEDPVDMLTWLERLKQNDPAAVLPGRSAPTPFTSADTAANVLQSGCGD